MNTNLKENWREILAKNIKSERQRLGFSQLALAKELGAKEGSTVSFWENGKGEFNMGTLYKLCVIFDRMPNDLMFEDLANAPQPPKKMANVKTDEIEDGGRGQPATAPEGELPEKKAELKEMKKQMLSLMQKLEEMDV